MENYKIILNQIEKTFQNSSKRPGADSCEKLDVSKKKNTDDDLVERRARVRHFMRY